MSTEQNEIKIDRPTRDLSEAAFGRALPARFVDELSYKVAEVVNDWLQANEVPDNIRDLVGVMPMLSKWATFLQNGGELTDGDAAFLLHCTFDALEGIDALVGSYGMV
jgi:hypothetical protein